MSESGEHIVNDNERSSLGITLTREISKAKSILWLISELDNSPNQIEEGVLSDAAYTVMDMLGTVESALVKLDVGYMPRN